jgi:hypothetical protein
MATPYAQNLEHCCCDRSCGGREPRQQGTVEVAVLLVCYLFFCHALFITQILDINLPICGISAIVAAIFLDLPIPPGTMREKVSRMDWMSVNYFVISTTY